MENPYIQMTEAGIRKMIEDSIKPFREDNRKLRLILGFASEHAAFLEGSDREQLLDSWFALASHSMETVSDDLPTELVAIVGAQIHKEEMERMKAEVYQGGMYPSLEEQKYLKSIFIRFRDQLTQWFFSNFTPEFMEKIEGEHMAEYFNASKHSGSYLFSLAWNSRITINRMLKVDFDRDEFERIWGNPEE